MADLQFFVFFRYEEEFERSECIVLPRRNPFQEYDDAKFCQHFRLLKFTVTKQLDEVHCRTWYYMSANIMKGSFCDYKIREASFTMLVYNKVHMDLSV